MTAIINPVPTSAVAQRILEVAASLIGEVGESGLRIEEVMSRAGVQAPVIYRHFGSREGLVQSAHLSRYIGSVAVGANEFAAATRVASDAATFRVAFDAMLEALLSETMIDAGFVKLEVLAMGMHRPEFVAMVREVQMINYAVPLQTLQLAQERGWVRADIDVQQFLAWAVSSGLGLSSVAFYRTDPAVADAWQAYQRRAITTALFGSDC